MRLWLTALTTALALVLSGCQLLGAAGEGPDVSEYFEDEQTQELARAVDRGDRSTIRELVDGGASLDTTGHEGLTLLQWAVLRGQNPALRTMLELGADPDQTGYQGSAVLHTAANATSARFVETLLEAGADPDVRHAVTERTPLMQAAGMATDDQFELLLDAGADISLADRTGVTALHLAAMVNAGSQVLTLLEKGADPLAKDRLDATFQDYFWSTDPKIMHAQALRNREKVGEWLTARDIPLHEKASWSKDGS